MLWCHLQRITSHSRPTFSTTISRQLLRPPEFCRILQKFGRRTDEEITPRQSWVFLPLRGKILKDYVRDTLFLWLNSLTYFLLSLDRIGLWTSRLHFDVLCKFCGLFFMQKHFPSAKYCEIDKNKIQSKGIILKIVRVCVKF